MLKPKIVKDYPITLMSLYKRVELWRFRGQYFRAYTGSDNMVQLYFADKNGEMKCTMGLLSMPGKSYDGAVQWLNKFVE